MLSELKVDSSVVSAEGSYTFTNVVSNHTISATFVVDNSAPGVPTVTVSSKTTSSFTVSAVATDSDGDNLVYNLYAKTTSESTYSLKDTSASTASGTQVSLTALELSQYTDYDYYVTVTDGSETSTSSNGTVRTYCSATGYTCTPYTCYTSDCSSCVDGYRLCTGEGQKMTCGTPGGYTCSECGGSIEYNGDYYYCYTCEGKLCSYSEKDEHRGTQSCSRCDGTGEKCTHGYTEEHLTCSHFDYADGSHSYCSHGYTEQHD